MIRVYTKERHIRKIENYLNSLSLEHQIYTVKDNPKSGDFELGVSYCYPRKITEPILSMPKKGFINYHPGPLPEYKGPNKWELLQANANGEDPDNSAYLEGEKDEGLRAEMAGVHTKETGN